MIDDRPDTALPMAFPPRPVQIMARNSETVPNHPMKVDEHARTYPDNRLREFGFLPTAGQEIIFRCPVFCRASIRSIGDEPTLISPRRPPWRANSVRPSG